MKLDAMTKLHRQSVANVLHGKQKLNSPQNLLRRNCHAI